MKHTFQKLQNSLKTDSFSYNEMQYLNEKFIKHITQLKSTSNNRSISSNVSKNLHVTLNVDHKIYT